MFDKLSNCKTVLVLGLVIILLHSNLSFGDAGNVPIPVAKLEAITVRVQPIERKKALKIALMKECKFLTGHC